MGKYGYGYGYHQRAHGRKKSDGLFSLDPYLSTLASSFRFNLRKTDRYFQDITGLTLADDAGEPIAFALDQAAWNGQTFAELVVAQPELLSNGQFDVDATGWVPTANVTQAVVAGRLKVTAVSGSSNFTSKQNLSGLVKDRVYRLSGTVESPVGNSAVRARLRFDSAPDIQAASAGVPITQSILKPYSQTVNAVSVDVANTGAFGAVGDVAYGDNISLKHIPGNYARQNGATSLCPKRQAEGAKFDGVDDNWLMAYKLSAGSNFIQARTTVPATLSGLQVIAGAQAASSANRLLLGINASGQACGGVGSDGPTTIVGISDLRGTEADIAVTCDGSTVRLIVNGAVEYEAAQVSTPTTTIPLRIGALNDNGAGASYYAGAIKDISAGTDFITQSRFNQIRAAIADNQ